MAAPESQSAAKGKYEHFKREVDRAKWWMAEMLARPSNNEAGSILPRHGLAAAGEI